MKQTKLLKGWSSSGSGGKATSVQNLRHVLTTKWSPESIAAGAVAAIGAVVLLFSVVTYTSKTGELQSKRSADEELVSLTQSVAKNASRATQGDKAALKKMEEDSARFAELLNKFRGVSSNWSPDVGVTAQSLEAVEKLWAPTQKNIKDILANRNELGLIQDRVARSESDLEGIKKSLNLFLQNASTEMTLTERNQAQLWVDTAQQMTINVVGLQGRPEVSPEVSFKVAKDVAYFGEVLRMFEKGSPENEIRVIQNSEAKAALAAIKKQFIEDGAESNLLALAGGMDEVQESKRWGVDVFAQSDKLLKEVKALAEQHRGLETQNQAWALGILIGVLLMLGAVAYYIYSKARMEKKRSEESRKENDRNLAAVHKLLSEIEGLGQGDLTKQATVGNGVTNEIALALNATVDDLRKLVSGVRKTTDDVTTMAETTNVMSTNLGDFANKQEVQIDTVAKNIGALAQELDGVAQQTSQSSDLANQALDLSKRGESVVNNTILGMNAIRDTIQETAKRIKSLGESSQEIGLVTQLIRDVGAKIQVLALNAAIQSADAGEAGKGFAVVAEEVQSLADDAAASAQKIDRLVQNIQGSAKEAIATMEVATSRVVEGTHTADSAGQALREIGQAAEELRNLVDKVTEKMQEGSENTTDLALSMGQVKYFTRAARENSEKFQGTVAQMKDSTRNLQESVGGFRLDVA
jgi:twitching motility protein PilJ